MAGFKTVESFLRDSSSFNASVAAIFDSAFQEIQWFRIVSKSKHLFQLDHVQALLYCQEVTV